VIENLCFTQYSGELYLHGWQIKLHFWRCIMPARTSDEKGVCPSVCLSVSQTRGLWQNRRKICPDFYTLQKII